MFVPTTLPPTSDTRIPAVSDASKLSTANGGGRYDSLSEIPLWATTETTYQNEESARPEVKRSNDIMRLQRVMWKITEDKTLAGCHRWKAGNTQRVSVVYSAPKAGTRGAKGAGRFAGLQNSHSVWGSPLAAVGILQGRRKQVTRAEKRWREMSEDHTTLFLTVTLRHKINTDLQYLWQSLGYCWSAMTSGGAWTGTKSYAGDKAHYGICHWVKAVEITHGKNGFHPHLHVMLFVDRKLSEEERETLQARMTKRWIKAAKRRGLEAPLEEHAVKLETTEEERAEERGAYLTKGMLEELGAVKDAKTGLALEVTYGSFKRARGENRTLFQVLEALADDLDAGRKMHGGDMQVWRTFEAVSKGKKFMSWSKGAKDALGVDDLTDEEIAELEAAEEREEAGTEYVVGTLSAESWKIIQSNIEARSAVVEAMGEERSPIKAQEAMARVLDALGVPYQLEMMLYEPEGNEVVARLGGSAEGNMVKRAEARAVLLA